MKQRTRDETSSDIERVVSAAWSSWSRRLARRNSRELKPSVAATSSSDGGLPSASIHQMRHLLIGLIRLAVHRQDRERSAAQGRHSAEMPLIEAHYACCPVTAGEGNECAIGKS